MVILTIPMVAYGFGVGQFLPGFSVNYSPAVTQMASEGCIRMKNDQVAELKKLVFVGAKVIVE